MLKFELEASMAISEVLVILSNGLPILFSFRVVKMVFRLHRNGCHHSHERGSAGSNNKYNNYSHDNNHGCNCCICCCCLRSPSHDYDDSHSYVTGKPF